VGAALVALPATSAAAATIAVNTTADNAPNSSECSGAAGDCSLRQALDKATSGDTVSVPANSTAYQVNGSPIPLPSGVSIVGGGASSTSVTGGGHNQIFTEGNGGSVTISAITLTDGLNPVSVNDEGGAVWVTDGNLTLDQVAITHSTSPQYGGAIEDDGGNLTITRSRFSYDSGQTQGGGAVDFYGSGALSLVDSSFDHDTSTYGGALLSESGATFAINRVTFAGDSSSGVGGGMEGDGSGSLHNVTFSGDSAASGGGGLEVQGTTTAINDTFAKNSSPNGANVHVYVRGTFNVENSIFASPSGSGSCAIDTGGTITDNGNNLEDASTTTCGFTAAKHDVIGRSPDLGSLANNGSKVAAAGGPPQTLALGKTSPALHSASPSGCTTVGSVDERTKMRPGLPGSACDIGAFELQVSKPKVSIRTPRNHARYVQGKVVHAKYTCREGQNGPGIKSCKGTVAKGKKINTKKLGKHTFRVTATSKDGLKFTHRVTYTVVKARSTAPGFTG
jgi:hypothetical protein